MLKLPGIPTDIGTQKILASYWTRVAFMEHAAIGAFARLTLELLSLGATPAILRKASSSIEEEIHHAEISFSLASHYSGESIGPWDYSWILSSWFRKVTKEVLAREGFIDGLIGEGIAAEMALWQSEKTSNTDLKNIFYIIYEDERKHALFWWEIVNWCFETANPDEYRKLEKTFLKILSEFDKKSKSSEEGYSSDNELTVDGLSEFGMIDKKSYLEIRKGIYTQSVSKLEELCKSHSFI